MREPIAINREEQVDQVRKAKEAAERQARRSDVLFITGAGLVTLGMLFVNWKLAPIAAGAFCLVIPVLELASGFLKGLRAKR